MTDANLHNFTEGAALNPGGEEVLRRRYGADKTPDLISDLVTMQESAVDFITDTREIRLVYDAVGTDANPLKDLHVVPRMQIGAEGVQWYADLGPLTMNAHAHGQVAATLQIPKRYYDRLLTDHPDMLAREVTDLWQREPSRRMVRTLDRRVRAVLSDRYQRIDHLDVLKVILPIINAPGSPWEVHEYGLTDAKLYMRVIMPGLAEEIRVGDVVQQGFTLDNSEVGLGALLIALLVMRVLCSNLAVLNEAGMRRIHVGRKQDDLYEILSEETKRLDGEAYMMKVRDYVTSLADPEGFQKIVARMRENADRPLANPVAATELLAKNVGLTEAERKAMLGAMIGGGDTTYWGAVNALTRTARDLGDYDRKADLEAAAGRLLVGDGADEIVEAEAA